MLRKQIYVGIGMGLAVAILLALANLPGAAAHFPPPSGDDEGARLAFALRWLLVPAVCLLIGIGFTANRRFFSVGGIDGSPAPDDRGLEIAQRYNRNTLEQTVLAAVAWSGVALALPHERLGLIGLLAVVFAAGRALFWIGYLAAPWARAVGFGLTFYPTVAVYVWLIWRAATT